MEELLVDLLTDAASLRTMGFGGHWSKDTFLVAPEWLQSSVRFVLLSANPRDRNRDLISSQL
jgi:hypothetical protein